jgi:hypothetical protein
VFALMAGAFVAAAIGVLPIHTGPGGAATGRMDAGSRPPAGFGPASGEAGS